MNRYLLSGAVLLAPMLLCMAMVTYLVVPSSDEVPQQGFPSVDAGPASESSEKKHATQEYSPDRGAGYEAGVTPRNDSREIVVAGSPAGSDEDTTRQEQAAHWEELAFSDQSDLQTRAESLVTLADLNPVRGEYAFESMISSDNVNDRQLAIALLGDWRNRSRDPDGRIRDILMRAASDPDAGVAYQAKAALGLVGNDTNGAQPYPSHYEGAEAWESGIQQ